LNDHGFLSKSISSFTNTLESMILTEDIGRKNGLFQILDPRIKLMTTVLFVVVIGLARSLWSLFFIFVLVICFTILSKIEPLFFLKRLMLFIPIFTVLIAIPALFITPGDPLAQVSGRVVITLQGARTAGFLVLRVTDSLSFGLLLILTTSWNNLMVALRWFRIPAIVVDILGMTYRYIFLFLHTANSMFLARRSRVIGGFSARENRRWLIRTLGTTLNRTQYLSEEVYLAMLARGYQGEALALDGPRLRGRDLAGLGVSLGVAGLLLWVNFS
jgi:cobalt/nickel transport system permease protein